MPNLAKNKLLHKNPLETRESEEPHLRVVNFYQEMYVYLEENPKYII